MTPDEDAIARTIYGEMRGEGEEGMSACASVIINRVKAQKPEFGLTPYDVCHKPFQFSCWNADDPNLPKIIAVTTDDPSFALACQIAEQATQFNWPDVTDGATFYYSGNVIPYWAANKNPCLTIGKTLFFNNIN